jgi:hypothetical protein
MGERARRRRTKSASSTLELAASSRTPAARPHSSSQGVCWERTPLSTSILMILFVSMAYISNFSGRLVHVIRSEQIPVAIMIEPFSLIHSADAIRTSSLHYKPHKSPRRKADNCSYGSVRYLKSLISSCSSEQCARALPKVNINL